MREEPPFIYLGDASFGGEKAGSEVRAFAEMSGERFHRRVDELLGGDKYPLCHCMAFRQMDLLARCRFVFGCDGKTHRRMRQMLTLALAVELGIGGALAGWTKASWQPWATEELIEGRGEDGAQVGVEVPDSLLMWLNVIGERTGCEMRGEIRDDVEGWHLFARNFARRYAVSATKPSAHEVLEARARLREMMEGS